MAADLGTDLYGNAFDSTAVPARVVEASYVAAYQLATAPAGLSVVTDPLKRVKRQTVDTIEREFLELGDDESSTPVMSQIEGILTPLLTAAYGEPWALVV